MTNNLKKGKLSKETSLLHLEVNAPDFKQKEDQ